MVGPGKGFKFVYRSEAEKAGTSFIYNANAQFIPHDQQIVKAPACAKGAKGLGKVEFSRTGQVPIFLKKNEKGTVEREYQK